LQAVGTHGDAERREHPWARERRDAEEGIEFFPEIHLRD